MSNRTRYYVALSLIGAALLFTCWYVIDRHKPHGLGVSVQKVAYSQRVP